MRFRVWGLSFGVWSLRILNGRLGGFGDCIVDFSVLMLEAQLDSEHGFYYSVLYKVLRKSLKPKP